MIVRLDPCPHNWLPGLLYYPYFSWKLTILDLLFLIISFWNFFPLISIFYKFHLIRNFKSREKRQSSNCIPENSSLSLPQLSQPKLAHILSCSIPGWFQSPLKHQKCNCTPNFSNYNQAAHKSNSYNNSDQRFGGFFASELKWQGKDPEVN